MNIHTGLKSGVACYTVRSGDNLSKIANYYYGNMSASNVNKIYYSNMRTIGPNPNLIYPGQRLVIPV